MLDVREEPEAQRAVDEAMTRWARAADAWDSITWVLARDPEIGTPLSESGKARALTVQGGRSIDMPTVTVVYTLEGHTVAVHSARFTDASATYVGRG